MSVRIFTKDQQGSGAFNGGEIVENKPIGFPQDHSPIRPYSNLFYWAHARAVTDSTIGLHPHKGFEICSFVLKGQIRHYDTQMKAWKPLEAGDVQIIRAGNGISHSEWMGENAEIFQIWFDPGLERTMQQAASYDDYKETDFPIEQIGQHLRVQHLAGGNSPFRMDTPRVQVQKIELTEGSHALAIEAGQIASIYVLEGEGLLNEDPIQQFDFAIAEATEAVNISTLAGVTLFVIFSPAQVEYRTYAHLARR